MNLIVARLNFLLLAAAMLAVTPGRAADIYRQAPQIAPSEYEGKVAETASKQVDLKQGPQPQWVWGPEQSQARYLIRRTFQVEQFTLATLVVTCDNAMTVKLNGEQVATGDEWAQPARVDVTRHLKVGKNELLIDARNAGGVAAAAAKLGWQAEDGKPQFLVTDSDWEAALPGQDQYQPVKLHGAMGVSPWGDVFSSGGGLPGAARNIFRTLPGYQVELLYTVPKEELGSWVCIAFDDKGRLIASDQGGKGLYRITPSPIGSDKPTVVEPLDVKITSAQGMLHAFGALYVSVNGGPGSGLYRCKDTNGDDQYDQVEKLKDFRGGGEHGPHALRLSPDGNSLYVIAGNHTDPPADFARSRIRSNWSEDHLLPRQWDARGHARGKLAPGGWIAKTDPDGKVWEMFSVGYRNPYDMDFNADGELFAYDADMEWDMGTPWYRPTRVVHATSGSEFGWRSGTGKWPTYYVDSLPPAVNIGPGSPVGVTFGYGAKFPAKYQNALYLLDWTFGTMYAVHLTPDGASYRAVKEEFVSRIPLPLTDAAVGPDGALYFTVGGRGTQSELFRVTYVGDESTAPAISRDTKHAEARAKRHALELLHAAPRDEAIEQIWTGLGDPDRHIRFAARTALEHLDAGLWAERVLAENEPRKLISGLVAFARQAPADAAQQARAIQKLNALDLPKLDRGLRLDAYRAYALLFVRQGRPAKDVLAAVDAKLSPLFPADNDDENSELARLLVYVNSPTVIEKTLKLIASPRKQSPEEISELLARNAGYGGTIAKMLSNLPELQNIHFAFVLRNMKYGWTLEQRKQYFAWLDEARERSGGASYQGFIDNIRKEALENASEAERAALAAVAPPPKPTQLPQPIGPGRKWTVEELVQLVDNKLEHRSFEGGKRAYAASRCIVCHRFNGEGGATGPDLTNVAARFQARDLAEAIVEPSKVISDQYRAHQIRTADGKAITGRLLTESEDGTVTVLTDPEDANKVMTIKKDDIDAIRPSQTSLMPRELVNPLNEDELADLLAYLLSRGDPEHPAFGGTE
ncbi:MAG: c-type cytochrome [Planctomycetales bacterium]|nr:c-type cytochrome [Planctomycetales bacterium]